MSEKLQDNVESRGNLIKALDDKTTVKENDLVKKIRVEEKILEVCKDEYDRLIESLKFVDQKSSYALIIIAALFAFYTSIFEVGDIRLYIMVAINVIACICTLLELITQRLKKINVEKLSLMYKEKKNYYNLISSLKNSYKYYNIYNSKRLKLKGRMYRLSVLMLIIQLMLLIVYLIII